MGNRLRGLPARWPGDRRSAKLEGGFNRTWTHWQGDGKHRALARPWLWVITGPAFLDDDGDGIVEYYTIGQNGVAVPTHYYKIFIAETSLGSSEYETMVHDRGKASFMCEASTFVGAWKGESPERRANQYAADLLLPVSLFQPRVRRMPFTFREVGALADEFQASRTATAIRLVEYGSYLGMVVCSTSRGRLWFVRSPDLPSAIWPHDEPGRQTLAYDLLSGKRVDGPVEVYASEWASYAGADRSAVKEDSIRITPDHVLSLIYWEDDTSLVGEAHDE